MTRIKLWLGIIACLLVIGLLPIKIWMHFALMETLENVQIEGKERITTGQQSKYLIFTKDETFENVDSWLALKFNSSDVYGALQEGQSCSLTVTGVRMPFFSWYRNILSAECKT